MFRGFLLLALAPLYAPAQPRELRLEVLSLFRPVELTLKPAPGTTLVIEGVGEPFVLEAGRAAGLRAAGPEVDVFAHRQTRSGRAVKITGRGGGPVRFSLAVPGKLRREYLATAEIRAVAGKLSALLRVELEDAVAAVVASELPTGAPRAAHEAMAVLARSYYAAAPRRHAAAEFCDTTHCQFHGSPPRADHPAIAAAAGTRGLMVAYAGQVFAPMYSASCGGRTRTAGEAGFSPEPYPYFAVPCRSCLQSAQPWERRLPREVAATLLHSPGEAARLEVTRRLGWKAVPGNHYTAELSGGDVVLRGAGEGHGVGVCQLGIVARAREGAAFRELLREYLPNTTVTGASSLSKTLPVFPSHL